MVSVILLWIYMLLTCYITGFSVLCLMAGRSGYRPEKESSILYAGIAAVTVYAQFFSIFYKVGLWANLLLVLVCLLCILVYHRDMAAHLLARRKTVTTAGAAVTVLLFLLLAYGTSGGIIHYDTGLYHAQSIRWIEEYGVVPGLGNLHSRLAYNSSAFALSALYSFSFLGGQSFHCCAGFLAFLLALVCKEGFTGGKLKKPELSVLIRVMAVYYLLIIFDEMISPASDYFMVMCVFAIVIKWLDLLEKGEKEAFPYGLLCVLGVLVLTFKLSGALILLLTLKPAVQLIREKKAGQILRFLGAGLLTALPFFIRNVILSGWLVYPITGLDLFSFDFKIPRGVAEYDAREIQVWGRGFSDVSRFDEPLMEWLPEWARSLDRINQIFLILAMAALVMLAGLLVYAVKKRKKDMTDFLFLSGVLAACFLFWLTSAPLIRYGCVFLWVLPMLVWGFFYRKITPGLDGGRLFLLVLVAAGLYKMGAFGRELYQSASADYLILQKDYENFETESYELHGYTFYYPVEGDRTGYTDFPASPVKAEDIFRGETIEEGFQDVIHS